jgi:hypothetical protein
MVEALMERLFQTGLVWLLSVGFLLIYFPGRTILMAMACNSRRLNGWDWVLSVIVPAYGLLKVLVNTSCR